MNNLGVVYYVTFAPTLYKGLISLCHKCFHSVTDILLSLSLVLLLHCTSVLKSCTLLFWNYSLHAATLQEKLCNFFVFIFFFISILIKH